ncbi:CDP-glycerol glycerophosphotransferase family protein [Bacillus halotolerans]|uniref:CDP-glycerol glycerophosphotransferase family protein n=1 Tax=Bacillus halotolerans TaxID=260554 RepID=A0A9Q4EKZ0_9BACI|nr:CDP-glycerol glycerophosphotransferase family protein [Bacillus halotolerans]MCY9185595.1 CDP-glycerol glycerophosphotransferase family protein [Bacillus halotolerans]MCY9200870.1 CDP-glycerol glycerophosphotransferase family protein [Bacillus halotolerans]
MIETTLLIPVGTQDNSLIQTYIDFVKGQSMNWNSLEIFFVVETDIADQNLDENVYLISNKNFDISLIKGEYVFLSNIEYRYDSGLLKSLTEKMNTNRVPIISANKLFNNNEFENIIASRIMKKQYLIDTYFFSTNIFNRDNLIQFFFEQDTMNIEMDFLGECFVDNELIEYSYQCNINSLKNIVSMKNKQFLETYGFLILETLMSYADSNVFLNNLLDKDHSDAYDTIKKVSEVISVEDIYDFNEVGYGTFFKLIQKDCYYEATEFMKLLKSKRHWFNQSRTYKSYFARVPLFEKSLSWKLTKPLRDLKYQYRHIKHLINKYLLIFLAYIVKLIYRKDVWLVGERYDQAEDNGYSFFEYCRTNHPDKKIFYIIDKGSPHAEKVERLGNILYHSSFKHKLFMFLANAYISAWTFQEGLYPWPSKVYNKYYKRILNEKYNICLQHGLIMYNISPYLHKEKYNQDLVISSSEKEKEIILNTLGYNSDEVIVTGLSRFDKLAKNKSNKDQILIMPTWRRSLVQMNKHNFLKSKYFVAYQSLLKNEKFLNMIEEKGIKVKFYMHYQMQKYIENFNVDHPQIEILTKNNAVVSDLIKESSLLVTDYSSVSADFLFMNKPVVFYQFDPYDNHSIRVNEIKSEDIGIVASEEETVVNNIIEICNRDFIIDKQYKESSKKIFKFKDDQNNERIFNTILKSVKRAN